MKTFSELALDKLDTLVVVVESDGSVAYISSSAKRLLGYEPEQLLGKEWWIKPRISETEGKEVLQKILAVLDKDSSLAPQSFEHALKTAQGNIKWFKWSSTILPENKLVGIGLDITDKKATEQKFIQMNQSLLDRNKEITDSLHYAKKIQQAILPNADQLKSVLNDAFVLYQPKDIVSGDYYFFYENEERIYIATVDCTGHGVPGAMMSVIANSILKEVFINKKVDSTDEILYQMDELLFNALNNNNQDAITYDGMDLSLCSIDKKNKMLEFSGAMRPVLIVRNEKIIEIKGSKFPLGFFEHRKYFEKKVIPLQTNDMLYMFTDGYCDQFGGDRNKKMNRKAFKELLCSISTMNCDEQEAFLEYAHKNWKQDEEQTDDILVIGCRI